MSEISGELSSSELEANQPRRWGVLLVWIVVLGLLVILGLGLIRTRQGPVGVGQEVPDFVLQTFDGDVFDIKDLRGQVVVINFWASWCKPCEQEAAELEQAYQKFKDQGVMFLGVDYVDSETEALGYLAKFNITYPNGPDKRTEISQAFRTRGVPETYIVGKDGKLVDVRIGPYMSLAEIERAVSNALQQ
jgi:cytochrome c biogenesis protein CcmG/thiol:disulfide interchange protein DsbE